MHSTQMILRSGTRLDMRLLAPDGEHTFVMVFKDSITVMKAAQWYGRAIIKSVDVSKVDPIYMMQVAELMHNTLVRMYYKQQQGDNDDMEGCPPPEDGPDFLHD